jgi:hypothetical protein
MVEKFDYLLNLPFEIMIKVLSELDIKDLDSFCLSAKKVEYGQEKIEMEELCDEIWRNKFFKRFQYDSSVDGKETWREKYLDQYEKYFVKNVQGLLNQLSRNYDPKDEKLWISIFDFLVENKEFFDLKTKSNLKFREVVFDKLEELAKKHKYAKKYIDLLFRS